MITYEFRKPDIEAAEQLIELSRLWVEEDCSYGMVVNETNDLQEPLVVALDDEKIVGYIFGHYYIQEKKTSYIEIGSECFSVDELYVLPEYRRHGIGKTLYRYLEDHVKEKCAYITLATSTKAYNAILKLYVEDLGMSFHSAFLIKKITVNSGEEAVCV